MNATTSTAVETAPYLDRTTGRARMIVGDEPFLILGIELHNSSSSGSSALERGLRAAQAVNANTVLASVTWESVEPTQGRFDFASVDVLVSEARRSGMRLVILWFGAWKNGSSSYAPAWVKRDWERFPRCVLDDGRLSDTLTPFGPTDLDADAFHALVAHVEAIDSDRRTVLMIQIENEIGLLGSSRDHSTWADTAFHAPMPTDLQQALAHRPGFRRDVPQSWSDVSGDPLVRDEAFMAWGYASHVERLASRARHVTDLPLFVNAWLDSEIELDIEGFAVAGGQVPGTYPSGGPLPRVADVWTTVAPSLDLLAPDFYFGDPDTVLGSFAEVSGGLFIPEQRRDQYGIGTAYLAIGQYRAIGVSPFGVDSAESSDVLALADAYRLLESAHALRADVAPDAESTGFHLSDTSPTVTRTVGRTVLTVSRLTGIGIDAAGAQAYGLVVELGDDDFLAVGRGFRIELSDTAPEWQVGLESVEELDTDGRCARRLNGDETAGGTAVLHPPVERGASPFPIPMDDAHTGISRFTVYRLPRHHRGDAPADPTNGRNRR